MKRGYRSLFWPVLLITVGVVWLLANLGIIPTANFALLLNLWPLLLIVIGLDIIFGRRSQVAGLLIGLLALLVIIGVLIWGPALGLRGAQPVVDTFQEPLGTTRQATVQLDMSSQPAQIYRSSDPDLLLDASIGHTGVVDYQVSGDLDKTISLKNSSGPGDWILWLSSNPSDLRWKIGLTDKIPLRLEIDGDSGGMDLNLTGLNLSGVNLDMASGSCNLQLPDSTSEYTANIDGASGSLVVALPVDTNLTVKIDGASGSISFELPAGAALRVEVRDSGSGSVRLPSGLARIQSGEDDEGVWETANYAAAPHQILLIINDVGSGSILVQ